MVEHNLSMSLNHYVPIFKCTPTGEVQLRSQTPPSSRDVTHLGSCDLALWTTGTFLNGVSRVRLRTLQILRVPGGGQPAPDLFQRVPPPPPPALSQTVTSSSASRDLKLISPLLTNAKVIYHVTGRREFRRFPLYASDAT